jgi:hypothetical protein
MVSALEYESKARIRFQPLGAVAPRNLRDDVFAVVDDRFANWSVQRIDPLVALCGAPVSSLAPYRVYLAQADRQSPRLVVGLVLPERGFDQVAWEAMRSR